MTMREANRHKKWLNCLKCGRRIYTDRCHRICPKCHQKNAKEGRIRQIYINSGRGGAGVESTHSAEEPLYWSSNS